MRLRLFILCTSLLVSGCVTTPQFEKISGVTPNSIIDVIQCELVQARTRYSDLKKWTAVAELSLQVDEQLTLAPAFTHTDIVSKSLTRVFDWGLKFDTQSQRLYGETVSFDIPKLKDSPWCQRRYTDGPTGISLNGNLGLVEVVGMAFGSIDPSDVGVQVKGSEKKSAFGTSVEFVVLKALTPSGPTWQLRHFKGPGKLFSTERTDTHKLTISFAPAKAGGHFVASEQNQKLNLQGYFSKTNRELQQLRQLQ